MTITLKVKQCCVGASDTPRFDAKVGDVVIIRQEVKIYEATIISILSSDNLVVFENSNESKPHTTIASSDILALVIQN